METWEWIAANWELMILWFAVGSLVTHPLLKTQAPGYTPPFLFLVLELIVFWPITLLLLLWVTGTPNFAHSPLRNYPHN